MTKAGESWGSFGSPGALYVLTGAIRCYPVLSGANALEGRTANYSSGEANHRRAQRARRMIRPWVEGWGASEPRVAGSVDKGCRGLPGTRWPFWREVCWRCHGQFISFRCGSELRADFRLVAVRVMANAAFAGGRAPSPRDHRPSTYIRGEKCK